MGVAAAGVVTVVVTGGLEPDPSGELDERRGEHAERERGDDRQRGDRRLPVGRRRQARARGGSAVQAPVLLGIERRAAQRTRFADARPLGGDRGEVNGGCRVGGRAGTRRAGAGRAARGIGRRGGDRHEPAAGGRMISVGCSPPAEVCGAAGGGDGERRPGAPLTTGETGSKVCVWGEACAGPGAAGAGAGAGAAAGATGAGAAAAAAGAAGAGAAAGPGAGAWATGAPRDGAPAIGRSTLRLIDRPQLGQKRSSPLWIAAQRGQAVMPASRRTVTGWRSDRLGLERAQLGVDAGERAQLGEHQRVVALSEAVQVEDEPAEVAVGELARLAQEARAAAHATARAEARRCRGRGERPSAGCPPAAARGRLRGVVADV